MNFVFILETHNQKFLDELELVVIVAHVYVRSCFVVVVVVNVVVVVVVTVTEDSQKKRFVLKMCFKVSKKIMVMFL